MSKMLPAFRFDIASHPEIVSAIVGSAAYLACPMDVGEDFNRVYSEANKTIFAIADDEGNVSTTGRLLPDTIAMSLVNAGITDPEHIEAIMETVINSLNATIYL